MSLHIFMQRLIIAVQALGQCIAAVLGIRMYAQQAVHIALRRALAMLALAFGFASMVHCVVVLALGSLACYIAS